MNLPNGTGIAGIIAAVTVLIPVAAQHPYASAAVGGCVALAYFRK